MKTFLKKQKFSLFPKNLIFLELGAGKLETQEAATEGKEKQNPVDFYEKNAEKLQEGTAMKKGIAETFKAFDAKLAEDIAARYDEGFDKIQQSLPQFKNSPELWNELLKQGATKVRILPNGEKWIFKFENDKGEDVLEKIAGERTGVRVTSMESRMGQAKVRGAARRERMATSASGREQYEYGEGLEAAQSNRDYKVDKSVQTLIDNQRLWLDAWQNPDTVTGMRELKQAITAAYPHLKNPDQVRTAIQKAIAHGSLANKLSASSNKAIDFEDLIEGLAEETKNPLRLPSWALPVEALTPEQAKDVARWPSLIGEPDRIEKFIQKDLNRNYVISLAKGFAQALKTLPNADCRLRSATSEAVTTIVTLNGHVYYVTIGKNAEIGIYNYPSKTPYKDSDGYDNSENYDADHVLMALDGRPDFSSKERNKADMNEWRGKIADWFINAVQPATESGVFKDGRDSILSTYKKLFNKDGSPKAIIANRPDLIEWYQNVFAGSHRVLKAIEGLKYNPTEAKEIAYEKAVQIGEAQIQRRNRNGAERFADQVTNPEDMEIANGLQFWQVQNELLKMGKGTGKYEQVTRMTNGLLQTLPPGTQALIVEPLPNHKVSGTPRITIKVKTPGYKTVTVKISDLTATNTVRITNNKGEEEIIQFSNNTMLTADSKMRTEFLNALDKLKMRETTWHDVLEGTRILARDSKLHETMSAEFAEIQLQNILRQRGAVEANGRLNEARALVVFSQLATKGLADLNSIAYTETHDDKSLATVKQNAANQMAKVESTLADNLVTIHQESNTRAINLGKGDLEDPNKAPLLLDLVRRGVAHEVQQMEEMKQNDTKKRLAELREEFEKDPNGRRAALAAIRKEYERNGKQPPEDLEQKFDQTVFPLMLALGVDLNTATVGPGVGVGVDIPLDEYGTIHVGGGIGAGIDVAGDNAGKVVGVGPGAAAGYTSPKWGSLSVTVGAGGGVNLLNGNLAGALGGALNIDLGGDRFNHKVSAGVAVMSVEGVGTFPVPTALFSYSPDHEYRQEHMWEDAQKVFGLEKESPSLQEIASTPQVARLIIAKHADRLQIAPTDSTEAVLNKIGEEQVMKDYKEIRRDLYMQVLRNYDPSKADSGATFGIGWDFENGRFIALYAPNFVDYDSKEAQLKSTKDQEAMENESALAQSFQIIDQIKKKGELTPAEEKRLTETGAIARTAEGKLVVLVPNAEAVAARPTVLTEIQDIPSLEKALNEIYAPLGLRAQYAPDKQMFELIVANKDANTNYEIAHSPSLHGEGIVLEGGKLYINSTFAENNTFTIKRSDYRYPFPYEGKLNHSIITISSDPNESPQSIYKSSSRVLRARGTTHNLDWEPASGINRDGVDIMEPQPRHRLTNEQFESEKAGLDYVDPEKEAHFYGEGGVWDTTTLEANERVAVTAEREKQIKDFAVKVMGEDGTSGRFAKEYRELSSNKRMLNDENAELIKAVQDEWAKEYPEGPALDDIEMQKALNHLTNLSFSPLGKTPEEREKNFEARLDRIKPKLERQFQLQIEKNHENHPDANDPYRINSDAKTLTNFALERARTVDINNGTRTNIANVDRYMSLAATMGIEGLRGAGYTGENLDPLYNLILMPEELTLPPAQQPPEVADLVKMAMEGLTPVPKTAEEFKKSPLAMQVFALMKQPESGLMFGNHPEYRYAIARIMSGELEYTEEENNAYEAFRQIVQAIRDGEMQGRQVVESPFNPNFTFTTNVEIKDGLYAKCTNYTMWVKERIGAQVNIPGRLRKSYAGFAGYGESTAGAEVGSLTQPSTVFKLAVAAAVKPPEGGGGGGGPEKPKPEPDVTEETDIEMPTNPDQPTDPNADAPATKKPEEQGADVG